MNFTRGQDPKESLKIGRHRDWSNIQKGDLFPAEFKLKLSCPEYYPLQYQKIVWATAIEIISVNLDKFLKCQIIDLDGYLFAKYDKDNNLWIIDS